MSAGNGHLGSAASSAPARVLVLTAHIGEGHATAADAIARELRAQRPQPQVRVEDGVAAMGPFMRWVLEDNSRLQFRWVPWLFTLIYLLLMHCRPARWLGRTALFRIGGGPLLRLIRAHDPSVVVSSYPGVTAVLGELRRRGRLAVPAVGTITDLTGLFFWAHPGVDLHLAAYEESIEAVERIAGPGSVRAVAPPVRPAFLEPRERGDARRALALPASGKVVAVSGGGWGVGDLEGAVSAALELDPAAVVCVTGRNSAARRHLAGAFGGDPRVRVLGFTERMSDLLSAVDVLVHSTGGVTCLEARARGCPVVVYGFPVGHARANAVAMAKLGLVDYARSRRGLVPALERALEASAVAPAPSRAVPAAGPLVLDARPRAARPAARRPVVRRVALAATASLSLAAWLLGSDDPYPVLARVMHASPVSAVATSHAEVGLIIDARPAAVDRLTGVLRRRGDHASFALREAPSRSSLADIRGSGCAVLPELPAPGRRGWLHIRRQLDGLERPPHAAVLTSQRGLTFGHYLLARHYGRPVEGAVRLAPWSLSGSPSLRRGELVVVTLDSSPPVAARELAATLSWIERSDLEPMTVDGLLRSAATVAPTAAERPSATTPAMATPSDPSRASATAVERQPSPATAGASRTGTAI